jgi:alpha-ribazole phosphatase
VGKLILVRHGHTPLNAHGKDERLRAWLDIPLDDQGLREGEEIAAKLAHLEVDGIYSSDLRRARQTAELIRQTTKSTITTTDELRPWNLGIFGGQLLREIIPFLNLLNEHPDLPAPNGESFHQFYARYAKRLFSILEHADRCTGYVVAVAHVRNLLAAKTIIERGDQDRVPVQGGPSTGCFLVIEKVEECWKISTDPELFPLNAARTDAVEVSGAVAIR